MRQFSFFRTLIGFLLIFCLLAYPLVFESKVMHLPSQWLLAEYHMLAEQPRPALFEEREDEDRRRKNKEKGRLNLQSLFPDMSASSPISLQLDFSNGRKQRR